MTILLTDQFVKLQSSLFEIVKIMLISLLSLNLTGFKMATVVSHIPHSSYVAFFIGYWC